MKIGFMKLHPNATIPTKAHIDDLGFDLYALERVTLPPNRIMKVRTGIAAKFPEGFGGIIKDRSGNAIKNELVTAAGVIDPQYTGELVVAIRWLGNGIPHHNYIVEANDKIAQMILVQSHECEIEELSVIPETTRGDKGFGSSGR